MSLKILGGQAKGFTIRPDRSAKLRPTSVLLKRRLFDAHQNFENHIFYDFCAGTGAIGLEALSRGASGAVFVEQSKKNCSSIKKSLGLIFEKYCLDTNESDHVHVLHSCSVRALRTKEILERKNEIGLEHIFFFDPPYEDHKLYADFLGNIQRFGFQGKLWVESDSQKGPSKDQITEWVGSPITSCYSQGSSYIVCFLIK